MHSSAGDCDFAAIGSQCIYTDRRKHQKFKYTITIIFCGVHIMIVISIRDRW